MNFVGVDLAWGGRAPSGVALIDAAGVLREVTTAGDDDDIVNRIRPWTDGPCLVAFDAPLVVVNPSGARPGEKLVNRYFGRYHAGCHSSNRGQAAFADGGRAHRLAGRLGLDVAMDSTVDKRAIEVYPHPAIVMLFGLDAILRYKARPGRTQPSRRDELLNLMSYMDSVAELDVAGSFAWQAIRAEVERTTTQAGLKPAEDRVDAVVCAYIAWYAEHHPESVRRLGTGPDGYLVVPVDPAMARRIDGLGTAAG